VGVWLFSFPPVQFTGVVGAVGSYPRRFFELPVEYVGVRQENSRKGTSTLKIVLARDSPVALLYLQQMHSSEFRTSCAPKF